MPLSEIRRGYFALNVTLPYDVRGYSQALLGNIGSVTGNGYRSGKKNVKREDQQDTTIRCFSLLFLTV